MLIVTEIYIICLHTVNSKEIVYIYMYTTVCLYKSVLTAISNVDVFPTHTFVDISFNALPASWWIGVSTNHYIDITNWVCFILCGVIQIDVITTRSFVEIFKNPSVSTWAPKTGTAACNNCYVSDWSTRSTFPITQVNVLSSSPPV